MNNFFHNLSIFLALTQRDWIQLRKELPGNLLNAGVVICLDVATFGYMLPKMGLPTDYIAPLYLGSTLLIVFSLGFGLALSHVIDLKEAKFIDYQITLPIPKRWLFASYVTHFIIKNSTLSVPVIIFGIVVLQSHFSFFNIHAFLLCAVAVCSLIMSGLFFLYLAFNSSFTWFMDNAWARCLSPLICLSCFFFTWSSLRAISPLLGLILLCSPFTFMAEGIRAAILPFGHFINIYYCLFALCFWSLLLAILLSRSLKIYRDFV